MRKPFYLEAALAGKPVVTRTGEAVLKVVSFVGIETGAIYPVLFATAAAGIRCCLADGKQFVGQVEGYRDLFMEVEDEVLWINAYRTAEGKKYNFSFPTEEAADAASLVYGNFRINGNVRLNGKAYKLVLD